MVAVSLLCRVLLSKSISEDILSCVYFDFRKIISDVLLEYSDELFLEDGIVSVFRCWLRVVLKLDVYRQELGKVMGVESVLVKREYMDFTFLYLDCGRVVEYIRSQKQFYLFCVYVEAYFPLGTIQNYLVMYNIYGLEMSVLPVLIERPESALYFCMSFMLSCRRKSITLAHVNGISVVCETLMNDEGSDITVDVRSVFEVREGKKRGRYVDKRKRYKIPGNDVFSEISLTEANLLFTDNVNVDYVLHVPPNSGQDELCALLDYVPFVNGCNVLITDNGNCLGYRVNSISIIPSFVVFEERMSKNFDLDRREAYNLYKRFVRYSVDSNLVILSDLNVCEIFKFNVSYHAGIARSWFESHDLFDNVF